MSQKYLRIILDNRLSFEEHRRIVSIKINRTIGLFTQTSMSQDPHFLVYVKLLSDLILIMVTLYMKKLIIHPFTRK